MVAAVYIGFPWTNGSTSDGPFGPTEGTNYGAKVGSLLPLVMAKGIMAPWLSGILYTSSLQT